jgi:hypothetical protein
MVGFASPLWTLYMLLPIRASKHGLFIQITSALLLLVNPYFVKRMAEDLSHWSIPLSRAAVCLTAFYLPNNNWSLQGREVGLLTLLISIATWGALLTYSSLVHEVLDDLGSLVERGLHETANVSRLRWTPGYQTSGLPREKRTEPDHKTGRGCSPDEFDTPRERHLAYLQSRGNSRPGRS